MFKTIIKKFYRKLAKRRLISRYVYLNEVDKILEEFITEKIMGGGSEDFLNKGRQELITKQNEITETAKLVEFLRRLK